eukprot:Lithocolla_globosa_v1_NODE_1095_length_2875_cov_9.641135.p5 type:complete len:123 gc:universal NODE_1095_length_2875_cov_9.641135:2504-2136(-)
MESNSMPGQWSAAEMDNTMRKRAIPAEQMERSRATRLDSSWTLSETIRRMAGITTSARRVHKRDHGQGGGGSRRSGLREAGGKLDMCPDTGSARGLAVERGETVVVGYRQREVSWGLGHGYR